MSPLNPDGSMSVPAMPAWSEEDLADLARLRRRDGWDDTRIAEEAAILAEPLAAYMVSPETVKKFREMWESVAPSEDT